MVTKVNRQWRVARYAEPDEPISTELFAWQEAALPEPADGEFLVRSLYLAPGPAQRAYIDARQNPLFGEALPPGAVMRGRGIGRVEISRHPDYQPGDIFIGSLGWQDYSLQKPAGKDFIFSTRKIEKPREPLSLHLGILGQAGGTAYFGLTEAGKLRTGDHVLISAAAGGVGSSAGQIARNLGAASVVGIAGSDAKCAWLVEELGFTAAINYRRKNLDAELARHFPAGVDVFLDNVGGSVLNSGLAHLAMHARVAIAGYISNQYATDFGSGPTHYPNLLFRRASMQGFVYFDYWERYAEAEEQLSHWYDAGQLVNTEDITNGLELMPDAVNDLFTGGNQGIRICRVTAA